jgi:hypothetical protein
MPPKAPRKMPDEAPANAAAGLPVSEHPMADLEELFITEYLRNRGYSPDQLHELPLEASSELLKEASRYATAKLAEVESQTVSMEEVHKSTASLE